MFARVNPAPYGTPLQTSLAGVSSELLHVPGFVCFSRVRSSSRLPRLLRPPLPLFSCAPIVAPFIKGGPPPLVFMRALRVPTGFAAVMVFAAHTSLSKKPRQPLGAAREVAGAPLRVASPAPPGGSARRGPCSVPPQGPTTAAPAPPPPLRCGGGFFAALN